jgi:hypothetical protein
MLAAIHVTDILAVNLEDGDIHELRYLLSQALFFLAVLVNVILEAFGGDRVISLIKRLDELVGDKLVLTLEFAEGLNIVVEGLNRLLERVTDLVEGIPKPDVLIWKELLVVWVFSLALGFLSWAERGLKHLLAMGLEKMSEEDWLKLWNLLKALNTFIEDV